MPSQSPASDARTASDPNFMESFARGLQVLRAFSSSAPHLSIAEASRITGLSRAATRRCLYTLQRLGYATVRNGAYALTPQVLTLGYSYLASAPLAVVAQPILERVSEQLRETSSLAVLDHDDILYVARSARKRLLSPGVAIGGRLPAYCTSMGRVLLAARPAAELTAYLDRLTIVAHTSHTVQSRSALRSELRRVRHQGFAFIDQELELGVRSFAVPVKTPDDRTVAAINAGVQNPTLPVRALVKDYLPVLSRAADELGQALALKTL
ncbi:MAG: IclR family transcriptional regulator C-terminal domain-containing protein [Vicinamibacterales bacterium]